MVDLPPVGVDLLAQIALPAGQRHEHDRQLQVGAGPRGVAGQDAKAAGIGVDLRPQRDLHREVGDPGARQKGIDRRHHWCPALIIAPKRFR